MMRKYNLTAAIIIITAIIVFVSCKTHFETTKTSFTASKSPQAFERGKVLAFSICAGCHYNRGVNKFIGNKIDDVPSIAGKVYSANLTQSKTHGIPPHYTDAELKYLLKTGVAKDGRFISYMLRPNMSEEDLNAIIVYLRSDDPAVAAADTTVGITHYSSVGKMFLDAAAKPVPYKTINNTPTESDPVALGAYLVDNLGCFHCHSQSLTKLNFTNPDQTKGYLAGGIKMKGKNGIDVIASNITPDKNTGIGNYTKDQFLKAVKDGEAPDRKLKVPMPQFKLLSTAEISSIYAYLQTVKPADHKVEIH